MLMLIGIFAFVGGLLIAATWSSIKGVQRSRRRRRSDRPYPL